MNIEDIQVGDLVYSYDTATGEVSQKAVTSTSALRSDHINLLTIVDEEGNEQVIEVTDGHPFWVVTDEPDLERAARDYVFENDVWLYHENVTPTEFGYWVEAKDLRVGDVFLGANGELSTLINAVRVEQDGGIAVFNFTVEGNHNYFILAKEYEYGQTCVLVHNGNCAGKGNSTKLREDMKKAGVYSHVKKPEAHHLIPGNHVAAEKARQILKKYDIDINSHWNGVFLSASKKGRTQAAIHTRRHDPDYIEEVTRRLEEVADRGKAVVLRVMQGIRLDLLTGNLHL